MLLMRKVGKYYKAWRALKPLKIVLDPVTIPLPKVILAAMVLVGFIVFSFTQLLWCQQLLQGHSFRIGDIKHKATGGQIHWQTKISHVILDSQRQKRLKTLVQLTSHCRDLMFKDMFMLDLQVFHVPQFYFKRSPEVPKTWHNWAVWFWAHV